MAERICTITFYDDDEGPITVQATSLLLYGEGPAAPSEGGGRMICAERVEIILKTVAEAA